jgi:hypothetical protein
MEGAVGRIERQGYVYPLRGNHAHELFGIWAYPPIEAELAGIFATEVFGAAHSLRIVSENGGSTVIRFCARDRRKTGLDGTMRIDLSGGLVDARWRYWNPARDAELAGGELSFIPASRVHDKLPLMSSSGVFWRRLSSGRFAQRWQRYLEWRFGTAR